MINFKDTILDGKQMIFNLNIQYFFKKTIFVLNEEKFVELVYIAQENSAKTQKTERIKYDTLLSQTRELRFADIPKAFERKLKTEQTLEYFLPLTVKQIKYIQKNYEEDLFAIDVNDLENIK